MTDWIVDPDPTTLRIGQGCEAKEYPHTEWVAATLRGHTRDKTDNYPWYVDADGLVWVAHIRVKKPTRYGPVSTAGAGKIIDKKEVETPYALVPLTREDAERLRKIAGKLSSSTSDLVYQQDLADRIEAHMPKQRPEVEIDEPVWVRRIPQNAWLKRHFARWDESGAPCCWDDGRTSFTADRAMPWNYIKTKDGTVWPEGCEK